MKSSCFTFLRLRCTVSIKRLRSIISLEISFALRVLSSSNQFSSIPCPLTSLYGQTLCAHKNCIQRTATIFSCISTFLLKVCTLTSLYFSTNFFVLSPFVFKISLKVLYQKPLIHLQFCAFVSSIQHTISLQLLLILSFFSVILPWNARKYFYPCNCSL